MNNQGIEIWFPPGTAICLVSLSIPALGSIQRRIPRVPEFFPSGIADGPSDAYYIRLSSA